MQHQQQTAQMMNTNPSQQAQQQPQTMLTTEQIQKCLDENKNLILAIMESQNLGKLNDCAQYQAQLQKNLMYLAAIADAQPPPSTPTGPSQPQPQPQTPMQATTPQGLFMQPSQPATQQLTSAYGARLPFPVQSFDQQSPHVQHQQTMAGVMGMRFPPPNSGFHPTMQTGHGTHFMDPRSRQDGSEAGPGDGQGK